MIHEYLGVPVQESWLPDALGVDMISFGPYDLMTNGRPFVWSKDGVVYSGVIPNSPHLKSWKRVAVGQPGFQPPRTVMVGDPDEDRILKWLKEEIDKKMGK